MACPRRLIGHLPALRQKQLATPWGGLPPARAHKPLDSLRKPHPKKSFLAPLATTAARRGAARRAEMRTGRATIRDDRAAVFISRITG